MTKEEITLRFFEKDNFVKGMNVEIVALTQAKAVVKVAVTENCLNANGNAQGGMLYTVADVAFAIHANYLHPKTVTQGGHIQYVRAAKTPYITATAREITRSGHNTVSEVVICDALENVLCVCTFNGFVKDVEWEELAAQMGENK